MRPASPFRNLLLSQLHTVPVCDDLCIDRAGQESVSIKHISETYIVKSYYDVKRTNDPYIQKIQEGSRGKNTLPIKSWIMGYQSPKEHPNHPSYDPGTTMSSPRKLQGASTRLADVVCACWGMFHAAWALEGNYHRSLDMLGSSFQSILSTLKLSRVPIANNLCF